MPNAHILSEKDCLSAVLDQLPVVKRGHHEDYSRFSTRLHSSPAENPVSSMKWYEGTLSDPLRLLAIADFTLALSIERAG